MEPGDQKMFNGLANAQPPKNNNEGVALTGKAQESLNKAETEGSSKVKSSYDE